MAGDPKDRRPPLEARTLTGVLDDLNERGFSDEFRVIDARTVRALGAGGTFPPEQMCVRECHRFEGVSDPDDMSILCAIETRTGVRGTLINAFGVYADPAIGAFLGEIPDRPVAPPS